MNPVEAPFLPSANLAQALRDRVIADRVPVIAEVKLASATQGPLMDPARVPELVAAYERGQAVAISVVTGAWFGGHIDLLRRVRALTALPLLRKDFIVTERDLQVSCEAGANAVLLTRRLLRADALSRLAERAVALGLTPFVELADRQELQSTPLPPSCVLALTNRDIRQREADGGDLRHSLALAPEVLNVPAAAHVSASGIGHPAEVTRLTAAGFDGCLVGTALMQSPDPAAWLLATRPVAARADALPPVADEVLP